MLKPYNCEKLPIRINMDIELFNLLSEAMKFYGQYLGLASVKEFNMDNLLLSFIKMDSYKSTQIEGTNVSQTDMFSLDYLPQNDDVKEILNYTKAFEFGRDLLKTNKISIDNINQMHSILLDSVRGGNKQPGDLRKIQNWIGPRGIGIENAEFIPPTPEEVPALMENFSIYFNERDYEIPELIQVAITHAQFETIHPYNDGNGRLGRLLIPLNLALVSGDEPVLYISEIIEQYKRAYAKALMDFRRGAPEKFVKFFLQCVIDQCNSYIYRINKINEIIKRDFEIIQEHFTTNNAILVHSLFIKNISLKTTDIVEMLKFNAQTVRSILSKLIELGILVKKESSTEYLYKDLFHIFVVEK